MTYNIHLVLLKLYWPAFSSPFRSSFRHCTTSINELINVLGCVRNSLHDAMHL